MRIIDCQRSSRPSSCIRFFSLQSLIDLLLTQASLLTRPQSIDRHVGFQSPQHKPKKMLFSSILKGVTAFKRSGKSTFDLEAQNKSKHVGLDVLLQPYFGQKHADHLKALNCLGKLYVRILLYLLLYAITFHIFCR